MFAPLRYDADRTQRELHALTEVAKTLTSARELPALLAAVMDKMIDVLAPAEAGAILAVGPFARVSSAQRRRSASTTRNCTTLGLRLGEAITGKVFDEGRAHLLQERRRKWRRPGGLAAGQSDGRIARALGSDASAGQRHRRAAARG